MKIHAIIVTDDAAPDRPQFVEARSHELVEADPGAWRDVVAEESKGTKSAVAVVIDVPDSDLLALLYPAATPMVPGKVYREGGS